MGATEQYNHTLQYGWMISLGGLTSLFLAWSFVNLIGKRAFDIYRLPSAVATDAPTEIDPFEDFKEDVEIRTGAVTFQTGNVFYEVLFTTIAPDHLFRNVWYLGFSVLTLALGTVAVVIGGTVIFWLEDYPTKRLKSSFAKNIQPSMTMLFWLHIGSLYTWLLAMMTSSAVKYSDMEGDNFWYFSVSTSSVALAITSVAWAFIFVKHKDLPLAHSEASAAEVMEFAQGVKPTLSRRGEPTALMHGARLSLVDEGWKPDGSGGRHMD